jgi:hypothetical protein
VLSLFFVPSIVPIPPLAFWGIYSEAALMLGGRPLRVAEFQSTWRSLEGETPTARTLLWDHELPAKAASNQLLTPLQWPFGVEG